MRVILLPTIIISLVFMVGCATSWKCPALESQYDNSNPPDNAICNYDTANGELIN